MRTDVVRIWTKWSQFEAEDFIGYPDGEEAHDLRDIDPSHVTFTSKAQPLNFNIIDCPEQNKRMYWDFGQLPDFVAVADVSRQHLTAH